MKIIYTIFFISIVSIALFSCVKSSPAPVKITKADTSKTLTSDGILIGNWNILTDTISFLGSNIMYHGVPTDHYIFTKYGNLYINEGLEQYVDTAVYSVTSINNNVSWLNSYFSANGNSSYTQTTTGPFVITSIDTASLVLTQNGPTPGGQRYEQIVFRKIK